MILFQRMGPAHQYKTAVLLAALALAGCGAGSDSDDAEPAATTEEPAATEQPAATAPEGAGGGEAAEASPEAPPRGPEGSELPASDEQAVRGAFEDYIRQINLRNSSAVCAAFVQGGLPLAELPVSRGSCPASVEASLGTRPRGGAPAWRRTEVVDITAVSVGDGEARVTATVVHEFADRKYTSVEEDVAYFREIGERWSVVQPSATLYRAVGYPEPPLRAFTPPR